MKDWWYIFGVPLMPLQIHETKVPVRNPDHWKKDDLQVVTIASAILFRSIPLAGDRFIVQVSGAGDVALPEG